MTTTLSKFTPGPWHVGAMNDALFVINEPPRPAPLDYINPTLKTKMVAKPSEPHEEGWTRDEYEANARLIAAAPELYHALKACQLQLLQSGIDNEYVSEALAEAQIALAKADGAQ